MIIGVDVDGVLARFMDKYLDFINKKHGISITIEEWTEFEPEVGFDIIDEVHCMAKNKSIMMSIERIPHSQLINLFVFDHIIKIVTSRSLYDKDVTKQWLQRWYLFDSIIWTWGRKKTLDEIGEIDILIDDKTDNIRDFLASGGKYGILLEQNWNKNDRYKINKYINKKTAIICKDWIDIYGEIKKIERETNNLRENI